MSNVDTQSDTVAKMLAAAAPINDLCQGGPHMRRMGKKYLPMFALEDETDYNARRESTWLFDGIGKAIEDIAGKVFSVPVSLADADGDLGKLTENIDMEGNDLSNFASDVFRAGLKDGLTFILADAPRREGEVTRGQAKAMELRPSLAHIPLASVLGWKWESVNNAPTVTMFRIMESVPDPEAGEFDDAKIEQIRVMDMAEARMRVRLYRKGSDAGRKDEWVIHEEYLTDLDHIPLSVFYTGRTGFLTAVPPLAPLAEANLAHWRTQSDKSSCLHKSLAPLLFLRQMGDLTETPGAVVKSADYAFAGNADNSAMDWVEITGNGISEGRQELQDIEKQMQWLGLQLMMDRSNTTATGDAIEDSKANSKLAMWADNLKDTLEQALTEMADMAGLSDDVSIVVTKDFTVQAHLTMPDVKDMYQAGAISRATYINEAKRRGILVDDVTPENEQELIQSEGLTGDGF